jgi:hypothetical protein
MQIETKKRYLWAKSITLLLLLGSSITSAIGQNNMSIADLLKLPGKMLGKGSNSRPVGQFKLLTYRAEELSLPRPITVEIGGRTTQVDKAFRLTVTGGPFPVRSLPPVIWVDDTVLGTGIENEQLNEITVITFDHSLLREGGTISLSYGESKEGRMALPEKLNLSGGR